MRSLQGAGSRGCGQVFLQRRERMKPSPFMGFPAEGGARPDVYVPCRPEKHVVAATRRPTVRFSTTAATSGPLIVRVAVGKGDSAVLNAAKVLCRGLEPQTVHRMHNRRISLFRARLTAHQKYHGPAPIRLTTNPGSCCKARSFGFRRLQSLGFPIKVARCYFDCGGAVLPSSIQLAVEVLPRVLRLRLAKHPQGSHRSDDQSYTMLLGSVLIVSGATPSSRRG
jgi:hypothetical protein